MNNCFWEEIHGFNSYREYERFLTWLGKQEKDGLIARVVMESVLPPELEAKYPSVYYFLCLSSGEVWELMEPDAPFPGSWHPKDQDTYAAFIERVLKRNRDPAE